MAGDSKQINPKSKQERAAAGGLSAYGNQASNSDPILQREKEDLKTKFERRVPETI